VLAFTQVRGARKVHGICEHWSYPSGQDGTGRNQTPENPARTERSRTGWTVRAKLKPPWPIGACEFKLLCRDNCVLEHERCTSDHGPDEFATPSGEQLSYRTLAGHGDI
jgi:hypothetical protein